jgi:GNAT superfamily N-acetyltransferase
MINSGIEFSSDPERIDIDVVHSFLSRSYWAQGRSREVVERSLRNSLCFGVYLHRHQIGFGRIVTDRAVYGYIADVFVLPEWRGRGIGKALMQTMLQHPDVVGLQVILLRSRDAQEFYRSLGFEELPRTHEMLGRYRR